MGEEVGVRIFTGASVHALDAKNRVTVPSRWRTEGGGSEFFALPDPAKPAIGLLLRDELVRLMEAVKTHPDLEGGERRAFLRLYFSQAHPCPTDRQGRVVLPAELCRTAGLSGEVVLVGTGERIEVWSPEAWEGEQKAAAAEFRSAAERLGL